MQKGRGEWQWAWLGALLTGAGLGFLVGVEGWYACSVLFFTAMSGVWPRGQLSAGTLKQPGVTGAAAGGSPTSPYGSPSLIQEAMSSQNG